MPLSPQFDARLGSGCAQRRQLAVQTKANGPRHQPKPRRTRAAPPRSNVTASVVGGPRHVRPSGKPPHPSSRSHMSHGGRWRRCTGCATGWTYRPVESRNQTTVQMAVNPTPMQGQPLGFRTAALVSPCPLCAPASGQTGVAPMDSRCAAAPRGGRRPSCGLEHHTRRRRVWIVAIFEVESSNPYVLPVSLGTVFHVFIVLPRPFC